MKTIADSFSVPRRLVVFSNELVPVFADDWVSIEESAIIANQKSLVELLSCLALSLSDSIQSGASMVI